MPQRTENVQATSDQVTQVTSNSGSEGEEFRAFESLAAKLLAVPKEEIDAERAKDDERKEKEGS